MSKLLFSIGSLFLLFSCSTSTTHFDSPTPWFPMNLGKGSHITIPLHLNETSLTALLDTGSAEVIVDRATGLAAGVRRNGNARFIKSIEGVMKLSEGDGAVFDVNGVKYSKRVVLQDLPAAFDFKMVLGAGIFRTYTWELDFPHSRIRLHDRNAFVADAKAAKLPMSDTDAGFVIPVSADAKAFDILIDTGSTRGLVLFSSATIMQELESAKAKPCASRGAQGVKVDGFESTVAVFKLGDIVLTNVKACNMYAGGSNRVNGLLGLGALKDFTVVFDTKHEGFYLQR